MTTRQRRQQREQENQRQPLPFGKIVDTSPVDVDLDSLDFSMHYVSANLELQATRHGQARFDPSIDLTATQEMPVVSDAEVVAILGGAPMTLLGTLAIAHPRALAAALARLVASGRITLREAGAVARAARIARLDGVS